MTTPVEVVIVGRDETGGAFQSAGGGLAKIGQIAMGILTSQVFTKLAEGMKNFAISIVEEARESELVLMGLEQTLSTMGGASGQTVESITALADAIAENSKYTDEAIISASGLMLTFDKIGQETFPRAQQMAVDMAAKFGMDLEQATIGLSKALQGTSGSLGALSKQGITFTDEQKKVIESLFETGHAAEAQAMIMDAIAPQVDGFAATQVTAWEKVQKKFDNIKEQLGTALLPAIDKLGEKFSQVLADPKFQEALEKLVTWLGENAPIAIDKAIEVIENLSGMFSGAKESLMDFIAPFMPAIRSIMDTFEKMRPSIEQTAQVLGVKLVAAGRELYEKVMPFLVSTLDKFAAWFAENRPLIEAFIAKLSERFAAWSDAIVKFWSVVEPLLSGFLDLILGLAELVMELATGDWEAAWETIKEIVVGVAESIWEAVVNLLDWIAGLMGSSLQKIGATWQANWNQLKNIVSQVGSIIRSSISSMLENVKSYFTNAWSNILGGISAFQSNIVSSASNIVNSVRSTFLNGISNFAQIGSTIITNIITGLQNNVNRFVQYLYDLINDALGGVLSALGITVGGGSTGGSTGGGGGTPKKASGGDVYAGVPVTVGELGRETFIPKIDGVIIPNGAGMTGSTVNNYYQPTINYFSATNARQAMKGLT